MLTGVVGDPKLETNYAAPIKSISMDQIAANSIGQATRFPSLQISCQEGAGVYNPRFGASGAIFGEEGAVSPTGSLMLNAARGMVTVAVREAW